MLGMNVILFTFIFNSIVIEDLWVFFVIFTKRFGIIYEKLWISADVNILVLLLWKVVICLMTQVSDLVCKTMREGGGCMTNAGCIIDAGFRSLYGSQEQEILPK